MEDWSPLTSNKSRSAVPGTVIALVTRRRSTMFGIPRRFSHFIFAVIQAGLTCLIAAGIASLPLMTIGQFLIHWLLSWVISWAAIAKSRQAATQQKSRLFDHLVGALSKGRRIMMPNAFFA